MKIKVTKEHIKKGVQNSPTNCPIALAMKDVGISNPRIGTNDFFYGSTQRFLGLLPISACNFIARFDARRFFQTCESNKFLPFEFETY